MCELGVRVGKLAFAACLWVVVQPGPALAGDVKIVDDGAVAIWGRAAPAGIVEPAVPTYFRGQLQGNFKVVEFYDRVPGQNSWPLTLADIAANMFLRLTYEKSDGTTAALGTSFVGTPSYRTAAGLSYVPAVSRADVSTGGSDRVQTLLTGQFGADASVSSRRTFPDPPLGSSTSKVTLQFTAQRDLVLDAAQLGNDSFRLGSLSSMFADHGTYDANVLRWQDPQGSVHTLRLADDTPRDAHLFPAPMEIKVGGFFELIKEAGAAWYPDSPSLHVTLLSVSNVTGRVGVQGWLAASTDPASDSLSVWLEWMDAPATISSGQTYGVVFAVTANHDGTSDPLLGAAVNASNLTWTTGGDSSWFRQSTVQHDGVAAAQSGRLSDNQQTWFQTTTNGPGSVLFWWKVASEPNDYLEFYGYTATQTQAVARISGNVNWSQYVTFLSDTNLYTLKWRYVKNGSVSSGSDAGWVDQVTWLPCPYAANVPQLFFQDASGLMASWILNSTGSYRFARVLASVGSWALKAAGDLDGDGVSDLVFQTPDGLTAVWFMNADGSQRTSRLLGNLGTWDVRACGDYLGLGRAQILFQSGGTVAYWLLDTNGNYQSAAICGTGLGTWKLCGAGDLDHDNRAELFFMADGKLAIWFHDGTNGTIRGVTAYTGMGTWQVRGAMDIDGDGVSDLVWQDPSGSTAGWFMKTNGTMRASVNWGNLGTWKLKAAGR